MESHSAAATLESCRKPMFTRGISRCHFVERLISTAAASLLDELLTEIASRTAQLEAVMGEVHQRVIERVASQSQSPSQSGGGAG